MIRRLLSEAGVLERVKDTGLYWAYLKACGYPSVAQMEREWQFYERLLDRHRNGLIFDIGANTGRKTSIFAGLGARVVSLEPSRESALVLRRRFARNPKVVIVEQGVGSAVEPGLFYHYGGTACESTFSQKRVQTSGGDPTDPASRVKEVRMVPMTTVDELIREFGRPDFVKIDTEGSELAVIRGLSEQVPLISFECNLPEFLAESIECLSIVGGRSAWVRFNYCIEEPPRKFESAEWLSTGDMVGVLKSGTLRYAEIFGRCG